MTDGHILDEKNTPYRYVFGWFWKGQTGENVIDHS